MDFKTELREVKTEEMTTVGSYLIVGENVVERFTSRWKVITDTVT